MKQHKTILVAPSSLPSKSVVVRMGLTVQYLVLGIGLWMVWAPRWLSGTVYGMPSTPQDATLGWVVRVVSVLALGYCPGGRVLVAKKALSRVPGVTPLAFHLGLAGTLIAVGAGLGGELDLGDALVGGLTGVLTSDGGDAVGMWVGIVGSVVSVLDGAVAFAGLMIAVAYLVGALVFVIPSHFERTNPYAAPPGDAVIPPPSPKVGVLVANLGTPVSPAPADVATFLRAFLSDSRVIEVAPAVWWFVLNLIIVPIRKYTSSVLYSRLFTDAGSSPLYVYGMDHAAKLQASLGPADYDVQLGMRYGEPSIAAAMAHFQEVGISKIVVMTAYPQYSGTTVASMYDAVYGAALKYRHVPAISVVPPYYDHPAYISAIANLVSAKLEQIPAEEKPDLTLFSFHGIPASYVHRGDPYPAHCEVTASLLAQELGLAPEAWHLAYQSQFGSDPWLQPYTDELLEELAESYTPPSSNPDAKLNILALCPGFLVDCLETTDEIGHESAKAFSEAGGGKLHLVPCLNAADVWIQASAQIIQDSLSTAMRPTSEAESS